MQGPIAWKELPLVQEESLACGISVKLVRSFNLQPLALPQLLCHTLSKATGMVGMLKFFFSWTPLASASCLITSKVCANFPDFGRIQFRDVVGEEYLQAAQHEAACLKRAEDFHHWCGNTGNISVAATFMPDKTQFYDPSACDAGWSQWQAFCYRFHLDLKTWREAEESCLAQDSHLASVHSMEENRFVHLLAHGLKVWIGYHHQQERFAWTDKSQEDFTNFVTGLQRAFVLC
eukprot:s693_g1.t1